MQFTKYDLGQLDKGRVVEIILSNGVQGATSGIKKQVV